MTKEISLPDELTVRSVSNIMNALLELVQSGTTLEVDASEVTTVDTCGVQLLISLRRTAEAHGNALVLLNPSNSLTEKAKAIGCELLIFGTEASI